MGDVGCELLAMAEKEHQMTASCRNQKRHEAALVGYATYIVSLRRVGVGWASFLSLRQVHSVPYDRSGSKVPPMPDG